MPIDPAAKFDLPAYLARIGFAGAPAADLAALAEICRLHPLAIPFENLTPLASGQTPSLDIDALQAKMIGARRGGYCYEHNHLLAHALHAIGFEVSGLAARVLWGRSDGPPPAQTHMVLRVRIDSADYLADAGFGGMTLTAPLKLQPDIEQQTPHGNFRLQKQGPDLDLQVMLGGEWRTTFRLGLDRRHRADYELANYWVATHPTSPFTVNLIASRPVQGGGRRSLFNRRLTEYAPDGEAQQRQLASIEELESVVDEMFDIEIPDRAAFRRAAERFPV
jgi:N-hydroxyarylamine O-acetyltransferase